MVSLRRRNSLRRVVRADLCRLTFYQDTSSIKPKPTFELIGIVAIRPDTRFLSESTGARLKGNFIYSGESPVRRRWLLRSDRKGSTVRPLLAGQSRSVEGLKSTHCGQ